MLGLSLTLGFILQHNRGRIGSYGSRRGVAPTQLAANDWHRRRNGGFKETRTQTVDQRHETQTDKFQTCHAGMCKVLTIRLANLTRVVRKHRHA